MPLKFKEFVTERCWPGYKPAPGKKAYEKGSCVREEVKDKYDEGEYDREGDMAKSDLRSIMANAKRVHDMLDDADNLPEWVQSKITLAEDYISTVANYMTSEMTEETIKEGMFSKKNPPPMHMIIRGYYDNMKQGYSEDDIIHHYNNAYGLKLKPGDIEKHIAKNLHGEDWQKVNRQDKTDGLSPAAVKAYRRENPGSKLQTAVTEKNPKGKRAKRRLSFCRRMKGMKARLTSAENSRDPDSPINKALRRWNC